ncbi:MULTISPECIES: MFS transporter [Paenibacillus]|uniref:MFS transporter n=1 Tax=Paenibacillus TaxID=44249 RepID=UPI0022B87FE4|nr:MFS transporter [Paenibacillus caseinilyticus]MCZ8520838.1 MFS transporter [Paenibacillus caseinilyticus]
MATFFLVLIYMAFISLGLPDSVLGSAWPLMQSDFGVPLGTAGYIAMSIAAGTILSSLLSGPVIGRFGTGLVTMVSCMLTAAALLGYAHAPSVAWLFLFAVPLGLGAGAVDAGLNSYVAAHYKAHHMSWLHCFWGVGATLGPIILSWYIDHDASWRDGYSTIAVIQWILVAVLLLSLPLWKRAASSHEADRADRTEEGAEPLPLEGTDSEKPPAKQGILLAMLSFLFYCGVEASVGLWGSSFLVHVKQLPASTAAGWISLYYAGITVGRLVTGFVTFRVSSRTLIRAGQLTALAGALLLLLPVPPVCSLIGLILVGLGCAPIFPCMLHETPARFGRRHAPRIMGYQIAAAYTGSTVLPPLLGALAASFTIGIFPVLVLLYALLMLIASERINTLLKARLQGGHL